MPGLALTSSVQCAPLKLAPYQGPTYRDGRTESPDEANDSADSNTPAPTELGIAPANQFLWPVAIPKISRGFTRAHHGIDFPGRLNSTIFAAHDGVVLYTGSGFNGYGRMIMLERGKVWASLYAHLNRILVREGQFVRAGERIGLMGTTGRSTGVHLHFELLKNKQPVNPMPWLGARFPDID